MSLAQFQKTFATLMRARFPLVYISTWEEERVIRAIEDTCRLERATKAILTWSQTQGLKPLDALNGHNDSCDPQKALSQIEAYPSPAIFILKDFHVYLTVPDRLPDMALIRSLRDLIPTLVKQGKMIVFTSPSLVLPDELQKTIHVLDFDLPDHPTIEDLLKRMIVANREKGSITVDLAYNALERLIQAALGLTYTEAENAFAYAMADSHKISIDGVATVQQIKEQIIKKSGNLECVNAPTHMNDIGGLDGLKTWLMKRDNSWLDGARRYGLPAPRGVLVTGVPGCGKSLLAKAISSLWQMPLLRFDISSIFSPYVGTSEDNMRKALRTAEAIAPCVLWIDEIEKGFSGSKSEQDGGVSSRILGQFLTWMQEKQQPVFVVATANNIDGLPAELLRKGRFDEIFFVDLPNVVEREDIFRIHLEKRLADPTVAGDFPKTSQTYRQLAALTDGFIGAEIEQAAISALYEAYAGNRALTLADVQAAIAACVPLSRTQAEYVTRIRTWAQTRAVPATLTLTEKALV